MKELNIREVQNILIEMLDEISIIFNRHAIPWFLSFGTLLGAVRHNGFIPWDDDIDLWVPIDEYKKACLVLDNESKYKLYHFWGEDNYCFNNAKLCDMQTLLVDSTWLGQIYKYKRGVAIDIFPLFGADNYHGIRKRMIDFSSSMVGGYYVSFYQKSSFRGSVKMRVLVYVDKMCFRHNMMFWIDKFYKLLKKNKGEILVADYWDANDIYHASDFYNVCMLNFENRQFPAPEGYDRILKKLYGDYMKLPSEKARVSHPGKKYFIEE